MRIYISYQAVAQLKKENCPISFAAVLGHPIYKYTCITLHP